MFIVIDGADGTGKTTLCPILAKTIGAVALRTPPEHFEKSREKIDRNASPLEKYNYYKAGVIETSKDIRKLAIEGKHVVIDRYWLTTIVYHEIIGVPTHRADFGDIIEPDLTIILTLNIDIQIQRMHTRGLSIRDEQMIEKQEIITAGYYRNIRKYNLPFVVLNTGLMTPEKCTSVCANIIKSMVN